MRAIQTVSHKKAREFDILWLKYKMEMFYFIVEYDSNHSGVEITLSDTPRPSMLI